MKTTELLAAVTLLLAPFVINYLALAWHVGRFF
jgi:hypothetical protein